jgi:hypothetical protein
VLLRSVFEVRVPIFVPTTGRNGRTRGGLRPDDALLSGTVRNGPNGPEGSYDIFEGTEQIQQLVIARAISDMRIE